MRSKLHCECFEEVSLAELCQNSNCLVFYVNSKAKTGDYAGVYASRRG